MSAKTTRRRFLGAAAAGAAWLALTGTLGCEPAQRARATVSPSRPGQAWSFRSRPDLSPPVVEVTSRARGTAPGYVFCAPKNGPDEAGPGQDGSLMLDESGQPVWFRPLRTEGKDAFDFKVQRYGGEPVLTLWEGVHNGHGQGEYVVLDGSYREVARVRAGNGYDGDHHEFQITPQDTALIAIYHEVPMDLTALGGPSDAKTLDGIIQEVDIETGEVLLEWHSLDHVDLEESFYEPPPDLKDPFDYFHINSIDVGSDGNLLVSARRTSTVYKIDRRSGEVVWRLGGERSDFEMGPGTWTAYQHDARWHPDGGITIFDNGGAEVDEQSRVIRLEIDESAMIATLVREYTHPDKVLAVTQGNVQVLPNGNLFVGWGSEPIFSEFNADGGLLYNAEFPPESESYRAFRFPWSGRPDDDPAVAAESRPKDKVTVYASWNGATEVATWEVLAGSDPDWLGAIAYAPRKGFETVIAVETTEPYVAARAKDGSGKTLGTSKAVKVERRGTSASVTGTRRGRTA